MDRADLDEPRARAACAELDALIVEMGERGLRMSSWYGGLERPADMVEYELANRGLDYEPLAGAADDARFPWFLYWEIAWLVLHNDYRPGQRLLDLGGCSSLFSCYMASKGLDVVAVDLKEELVDHGNELAAATGWSLRNLRMDMRALDAGELGGQFDHIASVCVFEHIPISGRIEVGGRIRDLLVDGGGFSISFDYANPSPLARIDSPEDVERQFVRPSGLRVRGNGDFHDNGLRYLLHPGHHPRAPEEGWDRPETSGPGEYTFGALFQARG